MRNRMKNVGMLAAFCVAAACVAVLAGCNPASGGGLLLAADVHTNGGFTDATIIGIQDKTTIVSSATVKVNGTTVPFFFFGNISSVPLINVGDPVTLHFADKDVDVQSTLTMPDVPTSITIPPATYYATNSLPLTWTSPATGTWDNIVVTVSSSYTVSSDGFTATLGPGVTSYTLPPNILTPGGSVPIIVEAMNSTTSLGSVSAGSVYQVANQAQLNITVN